MAIYHTRVKTFSRAKGHSSAAAAAYRAGLLIIETSGARHDYRRRGGVVETRCVAPENAPDWALAPSQLWAAAEAAERRKDATVAREFEIALPHELDDAQRSTLVVAIARALVERYGFAVQASIHAPDTSDGLNHHAHILATTRRIDAEGLNEKTRELDGGASGRLEVEWTREMVATTINAHLAAAQIDARVDHRSLQAQADAALERGDITSALILTRQPTQHVGKDATALQRRGQDTEREEANAAIRDANDDAFEAMLAKFEQQGRAMPVPERHTHENAQRERKRDTVIPLSSTPGGGEIRGLRGFGQQLLDTKVPDLSSPTEREHAAKVALEDAFWLWGHCFVNGVDVPMRSTARILQQRASLLAAFVQDPPFATYMRELLRRLKRLGRDAARFARRTAALASARLLFHRAQRALEHFDSSHPQPGAWSRAEWSKRRTRRVTVVEIRTKALLAARAGVSPEAEASYKAQTEASAQALEEWSIVVLKRYPVEVGHSEGGVATPIGELSPDLQTTISSEHVAKSSQGPRPSL